MKWPIRISYAQSSMVEYPIRTFCVIFLLFNATLSAPLVQLTFSNECIFDAAELHVREHWNVVQLLISLLTGFISCLC